MCTRTWQDIPEKSRQGRRVSERLASEDGKGERPTYSCPFAGPPKGLRDISALIIAGSICPFGRLGVKAYSYGVLDEPAH
jgi:hypothetical protein